MNAKFTTTFPYSRRASSERAATQAKEKWSSAGVFRPRIEGAALPLLAPDQHGSTSDASAPSEEEEGSSCDYV